MTTSASTPRQFSRPLVVFDGDCAFCTTSVHVIRDRIKPEADFVPWQRLDLTSLELTEEQVERAVQWLDDDGRASGAKAVALLLQRAARPWRAVGRIMMLPPFSWLAAAVYRVIANNRQRMPGGTPACAFPAAGRE